MKDYSSLYALVFWPDGDRIQTRVIRAGELDGWLDRGARLFLLAETRKECEKNLTLALRGDYLRTAGR